VGASLALHAIGLTVAWSMARTPRPVAQAAPVVAVQTVAFDVARPRKLAPLLPKLVASAEAATREVAPPPVVAPQPAESPARAEPRRARRQAKAKTVAPRQVAAAKPPADPTSGDGSAKPGGPRQETPAAGGGGVPLAAPSGGGSVAAPQAHVAQGQPALAATDGQPARQATPLRIAEATYPPAARHGGVQGNVTLAVDIDASGRVTAARVVRGLHPACDAAAREALLRSRFRPGLNAAGQAIPVRIRYTVRFVLD